MTPTEVAIRLLGAAAVSRVDPILGRGRNSRVFAVDGPGGRHALKLYPPVESDGRDRFGGETRALTFLAALGARDVPRLVAADAGLRAAALTWIDGAPPGAIAAADIDSILAFLMFLDACASDPAAASLGDASEAVPDLDTLLGQIDARASRLALEREDIPEARDFSARFAAARARHERRAREALRGVPVSGVRTLAPADFGYHNALRASDGSLAYLDFEYFGWDDPVKMAADFLHHPAFVLDAACRTRFAAGARRIWARDADFPRRLSATYPLYGLRWATILLNEFVPEIWRRRLEAGVETPDAWDAAKRRQLAKARALLDRMEREEATDFVELRAAAY